MKRCSRSVAVVLKGDEKERCVRCRAGTRCLDPFVAGALRLVRQILPSDRVVDHMDIARCRGGQPMAEPLHRICPVDDGWRMRRKFDGARMRSSLSVWSAQT